MKHAYLIMVHNNIENLKCLLKFIDYEKNDIFIHVDKKFKDFDFELIKRSVYKSNVYFTNRIDVRWGDFSQIKCELLLLELAIKTGKYAYYHLFSGLDLPIKSQVYIHRFFNENMGKEFVSFDNNVMNSFYESRCKYYYFGQRIIQKKLSNESLLKKVQSGLVYIQKRMNIDRIRNKEIQLQKGANWFSITDDFARYIVKNKKLITKMFRYTLCADELFMQTILMSSEFKNKLYFNESIHENNRNMRLIDWDRGNPYVFRIEDYDMIMHSEHMFARKFDLGIDSEIIEKLYNVLEEQKINI